jgi:hypothetical protein
MSQTKQEQKTESSSSNTSERVEWFHICMVLIVAVSLLCMGVILMIAAKKNITASQVVPVPMSQIVQGLGSPRS